MKQFRPAYAVVAGLVALAVAGCSGTTAEPSESPSPSSAAPTSSAPASPTPKPATSTSPAENLEKPEKPELASEFSAAGYEAFVEYWFETRNYAVATGDTAPLLEASDSRCGYCLKHQQGIEEIYGADGWVVGGQLIPSDFGTNLRELEDGLYHASFKLKQTDGTAYSSDGGKLSGYTFTPDTFEYEFFALHDDTAGWTAALIDLADGSK